ncbi:MAG: trehalose-6-phosphate synthase [Burkholderiales bacterium 70-64]|nr:MAG: trehalose-6-phosphate synthase [Burkholderiales bacterium 70-64]
MMRTLRLSLRFVVPLALALFVLALLVVPLVDALTMKWFVRDVEIRSGLVADSVQALIAAPLAAGDLPAIRERLERTTRDDRLEALALCTDDGTMMVHTSAWPASLGCQVGPAIATAPRGLIEGRLHVTAKPLAQGDRSLGTLLVAHDMNFVRRRSADARTWVIGVFLLTGLIVTAITVLMAHLSLRGWIASVRDMLRAEMSRASPAAPALAPAPAPEMTPLLGDLRDMLRDIESERRLHDDTTLQWTPHTLRTLLREQLSGDEIIVVSNREPYIHETGPDGPVVRRPASGLVTAVEPVMRACSGTWIAHGSGSADRETVDARDRVGVPPRNPSYTLRRVWLTEAEEAGYYYGFSNEGLWPLCHIAHVRPVFRSADWEQYRLVNRRFADAVVAEAKTEDPVVLVQDYHFALVPRYVREQLPKATIIVFWHIPWPNPESFGICPWKREILEGLLGSDILGFHTRYHCKNFLETVDRFLEARIEHESSTITVAGQPTRVEAYPISIAWPDPPASETPPAERVAAARAALRERWELPESHCIALGVDRLDYTKGIIERLRAVERLLELHPEWIGRFTLIQIAAPSRAALDEYQRFQAQVRELAAHIDERFGGNGPPPVRLLVEHHDSESVQAHYRGCDVCVVTSLHDGMNLVAKEFIGARDDERGVLVLSQFAGAARELHEALIVNPYHIDQVAEALHAALTMPEAEQQARMHSMRQLVREFNVYRWAGRMLLDAGRLRRRARLHARLGETDTAPKT